MARLPPAWTQGPYLDEADSTWFDPGRPVVGHRPDRDMSIGDPTCAW